MNTSERRANKKLRCRLSSRAGFTLVEVLVALAIMGMTVAFIGGVYTALAASQVNKEYINAENLAKSQMESVMKQSYVLADSENSYQIIDVPQDLIDAGYEINLEVEDVPDTNNAVIQKITVEVRVNKGEEIKTVITLVDYKLNDA
jgi:prepilin-type N-terminal cleavage/methylation domain-containing protein